LANLYNKSILGLGSVIIPRVPTLKFDYECKNNIIYRYSHKGTTGQDTTLQDYDRAQFVVNHYPTDHTHDNNNM